MPETVRRWIRPVSRPIRTRAPRRVSPRRSPRTAAGSPAGAQRGRWSRDEPQELLHPAVLENESSRSTTKIRVEPGGINGDGDCLP